MIVVQNPDCYQAYMQVLKLDAIMMEQMEIVVTLRPACLLLMCAGAHVPGLKIPMKVSKSMQRFRNLKDAVRHVRRRPGSASSGTARRRPAPARLRPTSSPASRRPRDTKCNFFDQRQYVPVCLVVTSDAFVTTPHGHAPAK